MLPLLFARSTGGDVATLDSIYRTAIAYGPNLLVSGNPATSGGGVLVAAPALTLEVATRAAPSTVLATLADTDTRTFLDVLNDVGFASFIIANDDTDYPQIVMDRLVRFKVKGVAAFAMLIEGMEIATRAEGEEHDHVTAVTGRGHLAVMEEAVVYPARGVGYKPIEEDRTFNWTAPTGVYDDTWWKPATEIVRQDGTSAYWTGLPSDDWPDPTAYWIGPGKQDPTFPEVDEWAPVGDSFFRRDVTIPAGANLIKIFLSADQQADLYIDGQRVITSAFITGIPTDIHITTIEISPGVHTFAVKQFNNLSPADNDPLEPKLTNPGGFIVAAYTVDWLGELGDLIFHTDNGWKVVEYPDYPPGMTPGQAIRVAVEEAIARGAISAITFGFTDTTDSAGVPWPEVADIATKVGTDYLTWLKELTVSYIDVWMDPTGWVLHAWVRGGRGRAKAVTLTAGGNLVDLSHTKSS